MKWLCYIGIHKYSHIYHKWNDENVILYKCEWCKNNKIKNGRFTIKNLFVRNK